MAWPHALQLGVAGLLERQYCSSVLHLFSSWKQKSNQHTKSPSYSLTPYLQQRGKLPRDLLVLFVVLVEPVRVLEGLLLLLRQQLLLLGDLLRLLGGLPLARSQLAP